MESKQTTDKVIDRVDQNQEGLHKLQEDGEFFTIVFDAVMKEVCKRFNIEDAVSRL